MTKPLVAFYWVRANKHQKNRHFLNLKMSHKGSQYGRFSLNNKRDLKDFTNYLYWIFLLYLSQ